jgi:hypothetical protein
MNSQIWRSRKLKKNNKDTLIYIPDFGLASKIRAQGFNVVDNDKEHVELAVLCTDGVRMVEEKRGPFYYPIKANAENKIFYHYHENKKFDGDSICIADGDETLIKQIKYALKITD